MVDEFEEHYSQRPELLFIWHGDWKERGQGVAKLLQGANSGLVYFKVQLHDTTKIVGNSIIFAVAGHCVMRSSSNNDTCWLWMARVRSSGNKEVAQVALRFESVELPLTFKEEFKDAQALSRAACGF